MGFGSRLLSDSEDLVLEVRPHWWFFAGPVATVIATVALATVVASAGAHEIVQVPFIAVAVSATVWLAARYVRWATTGIVLTSERLIVVQGLTGRRSSELPLARVAGVRVRRRVADRLLGSGALLVTAAPDGSVRTLTHVPRPGDVCDQIERCADDVLDARAGRDRNRGDVSLAAELEHLDELRRRGVLSEDEFRAGKARLLGGP